MRGESRSSPATSRKKIPRIDATKAAEILAHCDRKLESLQPLLWDGKRLAFRDFLAALGEDVLKLACQPGSWGERMRARIMTDLAPAFGQLHELTLERVAHCSSIITACFLLELGRRLGNLEAEFPNDPADEFARFNIRVGNETPVHKIGNEQLLLLTSRCGPALVSLCYFGESGSRQMIEQELKTYKELRSRVVPFIPSTH